MTTTPAPTPPETILADLAVEFVNAILDSVDTAVIKPMDFWERAKTALETGAAISTTWATCVSKTGRKLQISTLTKSSGETVTRIGIALGDPAAFAAFRRLIARDGIYLIAMARVARDTRRAERAETRNPRPAATQTALIGADA